MSSLGCFHFTVSKYKTNAKLILGDTGYVISIKRDSNSNKCISLKSYSACYVYIVYEVSHKLLKITNEAFQHTCNLNILQLS